MFMQHANSQQQHVLQPAERAAGAAGDQLHVWRPHRRSDHPAGLRRPRPGVLLLQPGRGLQPDRDGSRTPDVHPRSRRWTATSRYGATGAQTTVNVLRAGACDGLSASSRRPAIRDDQGVARVDSRRRPRRRARSRRTRDVAEHGDVRLPGAEQGHPAHADDEHHGEPDAEAPPAGFVLLAALHRHAGHAEQRATPPFPGFPAFGDQTSYRTTASMSLRSTMSTAIVNELRGGWQWSPVGFFANAKPGMFDNQGGYRVDAGLRPDQGAAVPGNATQPTARPSATPPTARWPTS